MAFALAFVTFLLGGGVGMLVVGFVVLSRMAERTRAQLAEVTDLLRETDATARHLAQEQTRHRDATSTVLVASVRRVARELVVEIREAAKDQRNMIRLLVESMPPAAASSEGWPPARSTPPASAPRASVPTSARRPMTPATPGASMLPADAPTPPVGLSVAALLDRPDTDTEGAR